MSSSRSVISGPGVPTGLGPYSPAVRAGGFLFVSGQPGIDPDTGTAVGAGFEEQATQAFRNLAAVLDVGGSRPSLVVNTTVLVADVSSFEILNRLFGEFFPDDPPARMTMQVPLPGGLLVSIGAIAVVED